MVKANFDIRIRAKKCGVLLWEIADYLGISEPTLTRKLRRELSANEKAQYFEAIQEISAKHKGVS